MAKMDNIRNYYDTTDTSTEMEAALESGAAHWETEAVVDPMVGTSLRLPRSVLEAVRAEASARHVPTTTLIRAWITEALSRSSQAPTPETNELGREVRELRQELRALTTLVQQRTDPEGKIAMPHGRSVSARKGVKLPFGKSAAAPKSGVYETPSPAQTGVRRTATSAWARTARSAMVKSAAKSALSTKGKSGQVVTKSGEATRKGSK